MRSFINILSILCFLASVSLKTFAQDPVLLHCTEVDGQGNVTLWWSPPTNSTGFDQYVIYYSGNGTDFTRIDSIDIPLTNSYVHIGAMAGQASRHYFLEVQYETSVAFSDTLATIFLQLNNLNFNQAQLYWNAVKDPLPVGSSDTYSIYREFPQGNWQQTNTTQDLDYTEPVVVCNDSISYRIEIGHENGCRSVSNTDGAWFKILDEPAKPVIDSISIDDNEHVVIGWESAGNAQAYIVYRFEQGIWVPLDTVIGKDNTYYTDTSYNPCSYQTAWTVATIDSCGSSGPKDENEQRQNILVREASYDPCKGAVTLQWTNYRGPVAEEYEIWVAENDGSFIRAGINQQQDTTFEYPVPNVGSQYNFYVRARFTGGSSTTCRRAVQTYGYAAPSMLYLANATVLPSGEVELKALVDTLAPQSGWQVWRSEQNGGNLSVLDTIPGGEQVPRPLAYVDSSAITAGGYYQYSMAALDSCGNDVVRSNELKTIWLTVSAADEDRNQLQWNAFEGWDAGVSRYRIYRMVDGAEPDGPIDSVSGLTLEYTDDYSTLPGLSGPLVYWVQALEAEGNGYGLREKSDSNRSGVTLESEMYLASAFRPNGQTETFRPVFRFYNGRNYLFQIYNRWGKLVFETYDPYQGWDGRFMDNPVPRGTYIYRLVYQLIDGSYTEKKGTVTVLY